MESYPVEQFYDERQRPLTAPSRPMPRRGARLANAHRHGSYAHIHAGSQVPHKHVIEGAGLVQPDELLAAAEAPARRKRLAKTA